jgi:protein involved in polysaccharide export with SLBB domain
MKTRLQPIWTHGNVSSKSFHVVMNKRIISILGLMFVGCSYVFSASAESYIPPEQNQPHAQFQQAKELAAQKQLDIAATQKALDNLQDQKEQWQREITGTKSKMAFAKEKLNQATTTGNQDEFNKFKGQYDNWEKHMKIAVIELEKTEINISEATATLQTKIRGKPEAGLILPGESIQVYVTEDETFNGPYPVRQGGYIIMPRVGRVFVAGLDLSGAEKAIKEALEVSQIKNPTVMVERAEGNGGEPVIYLAGEFLHPGAWKIPHDLSPTIVTTVLRSGGLAAGADLTKVRLLRLVSGQSLAEEINVQAILNGTGLPSDISLQPGDIVMVPPFANVAYVTGNVMKPGAMKLLPDEELTVYSAILRAGGFSRFANKKKVYVLRELGNGDKQKIPVDIRALQEGGGGDLVLKSKDIVVVPERFLSL